MGNGGAGTEPKGEGFFIDEDLEPDGCNILLRGLGLGISA
jgi:hypothetical protein